MTTSAIRGEPCCNELHATNDNRITAPAGLPEAPRGPYDVATLYQAWFWTVHRWIRMLGGSAIDAEDLTQEVFIVVQRKLRGFDGANLAGWLYRIAQLTVRDHRQRPWFRNVVMRPRDVVVEDVVSQADGQDEQLDRKEREAQLCRLIGQLNPRWRDSFLLFEVIGLTGEDIAALQGIPAATVRTHLSRARKEIVALRSARQAGADRRRSDHAARVTRCALDRPTRG